MMDMDLTVKSAGIAWAVPVKADQLGHHLEVFNKRLPVLHALRLCHRFGKGPDVHVTKLPHELLLVVEQAIFDPESLGFWDNWKENFKHFESKCEPIDHIYDDRYLDLRDEFSDTWCGHCLDFDSHLCKDGCQERTTKLANERMDEEREWRYEDCEEYRVAWMSMISQKSNGRFADYDKLLLKHFGLEAFFATTRKADGDNSSWPEHANYHWHEPNNEISTTICYLTLPRVAAKNEEYPVSEMEADCGSFYVQGLHSSFVQLPDLSNREKKVKQFRRALTTLKLQPYVHPSQLRLTVSAEIRQHSQEQKLEEQREDTVQGRNLQSFAPE